MTRKKTGLEPVTAAQLGKLERQLGRRGAQVMGAAIKNASKGERRQAHLGRMIALGSDEKPAHNIGYMARMLVLCTLPHAERKTKTTEPVKRSNGRYTLYVQPGVDGKMPYGIYPRLIMAYFTEQVQRTKRRDVVLGKDFTEFMRKLGLEPKYGRGGNVAQLREQLRRLLGARIWIEMDGEANPLAHVRSLHVADDWDLWWNPERPEQPSLIDSTVTLGEKLFRDMVDNPVPFDWRVVEEIRDSPLAVDLYIWLGLRVSYLRGESAIMSWSQVAEQLGADYANPKEFARQAKKQLERIALAWPGLKYDTPRGRLSLYPSATHVPKKIEGAN